MHRNYGPDPDDDPFTEESLRTARAMMRLDEFEVRCPAAAADLVRIAGGRERVVSILPDDDPHCDWSALCEDQPVPRGTQLAGRRDQVAVYVRATHPSIDDSSNAGRLFGSQWIWEDEL
jgi:hypothetical protein